MKSKYKYKIHPVYTMAGILRNLPTLNIPIKLRITFNYHTQFPQKSQSTLIMPHLWAETNSSNLYVHADLFSGGSGTPLLSSDLSDSAVLHAVRMINVSHLLTDKIVAAKLRRVRI